MRKEKKYFELKGLMYSIAPDECDDFAYLDSSCSGCSFEEDMDGCLKIKVIAGEKNNSCGDVNSIFRLENNYFKPREL